MPEKIADKQPPAGLSRALYRMPIWFYRHHLGWLMGSHLLLLNHTGRMSGQPRQVVLEVMRYDQASDTYLVMSGWGEKSDWFRNVQKTPQVTIQAGRRRAEAVAECLPADEAGDEIVNYARHSPAMAKSLVGITGYRVDGTEADFRALSNILPVVALRCVARSN